MKVDIPIKNKNIKYKLMSHISDRLYNLFLFIFILFIETIIRAGFLPEKKVSFHTLIFIYHFLFCSDMKQAKKKTKVWTISDHQQQTRENVPWLKNNASLKYIFSQWTRINVIMQIRTTFLVTAPSVLSHYTLQTANDERGQLLLENISSG